MSDTLNQLLFGGYPYFVIGVFIVGHIWRYKTDQYSWTTRSSQLLEKRLLMIGSISFHLGMLAVLGGHIVGLLIPKAWLSALGVSEHLYHLGAQVLGTIAGVVMAFGMIVLLIRRASNKRMRKVTVGSDYLALGFLALAIATGMVATIGINIFGAGYDYRETIGPWVRSVITLRPDAALMAAVPTAFKIHVLSTMTLFLLWPFTRLVHAWSVPLSYLSRTMIVYRRRGAIQPGKGGFR